MTLFDLVFALVFLSSCVTMIGAGVAVVRGRRQRAGIITRRLVIALGAYFGVVATVAVATPQRFLPIGQQQCSDDWCIVADSARREVSPAGVTYAIGFSLSSRARRVPQRERFVVAYLQTGDGRRIDAVRDSAAIPFDTLLQPGQTVRAMRRFLVTPPTRDVGLIVAREGGFRFPGCCIIGDDNSFLHKRTMMKLE